MRDNSNWNLKFNRSSKDSYGCNLTSDDLREEKNTTLYVGVLMVVAETLGVIFF